MINCNISGLGVLCAQLMLEDVVRERVAPTDPNDPVSQTEIDRIEGWLKIASEFANEFEWPSVHDRIELLRKRLVGKRGVLTQGMLASELRVLLETIDSGLNGQYIYRYPKAKAEVFMSWKTDWAAVLKAFPSAEMDIRAGVDLWALHHSTASVFHCMRVLEHGLRAMATDVGVNFSIQNWQNVIEEIEAAIRKLRASLPRGDARNDRLQFLSESAKELFYFKDGWRNYVSHNRGSYDEHQARSVLEHVKAFMTVLSTKLSEQFP